jgi:hypothetical protein
MSGPHKRIFLPNFAVPFPLTRHRVNRELRLGDERMPSLLSPAAKHRATSGSRHAGAKANTLCASAFIWSIRRKHNWHYITVSDNVSSKNTAFLCYF